MDIIWHGYSCFTLKTKNCTTVIDPYGTEIGLKLPQLKADVVLVSHDHEGHNNSKAVAGEPRLIDWPGEYEVKSMAITALSLPYEKEGSEEKKGEGLIFLMNIDGLRICFLGDIGDVPNDVLIESIGDVDILMLPVGGGNVLDAKKAHMVIEELEPRAVIPMHYATPGVKAQIDGAEPFLKAIGASTIEPKDKFTVSTHSELDGEKTICILLNPQLG